MALRYPTAACAWHCSESGEVASGATSIHSGESSSPDTATSLAPASASSDGT